MDMLFDWMFGKVDENKTYYTEDMFAREVGQFVLFVLIQKGILKDDELIKYKEQFMKVRNELMIEEMKKEIEERKHAK